MKRIATMLMVAVVLSSSAFAEDGCVLNGMDKLSAGFGHLQSNDYQSAFECFQAVAETQPMAAFNLGVMYTTGSGTEADDSQAIRWLTKAAEGGVGKAQYNLGVRYFWGDGVPTDYEEAYKWFDVALHSGYMNAANALRAASFRLTPEGIANAERSSSEFLNRWQGQWRP